MNPQSARYQTTYAEPAAAGSLLDAVLDATGSFPTERRTASATPTGRLEQFLREPNIGESLRLWIGELPNLKGSELRRKLTQRLNQDAGRLDALLTDQLNAVLHHPDFQKLEASWRGLWFLVESVPDGANVKVRVLNAAWKEIVRDQERAIEFDQSQLFRKVYNEEFGMPGGEPYGLLVGAYDLTPRPFADHPTDDVAALQGIASVAAAAFAPFVSAADPRFLELDSFTELELPIDIGRTFEQAEFLKWRRFRDGEDSRFVGLALPRVLYRRPYDDSPGHTHHFDFREDTSAPDGSSYLWGNPVFALAAVAVRTYAESGWLADIRGARPDDSTGGRVVGLPRIGYGTGTSETARSVTEAHLTDAREKELGDLGFIPLSHTPGAAEAAFYSTPSVQKPKTYTDAPANANARLSCMMHYMLCVSRFAQYLKVMMRDRVGAFTTPASVEHYLNNWLSKYVVSNDDASNDMKARYPLREGRAAVREVVGKPGVYQCTVYLRPHFQLDQLSVGIKLSTQLATLSAG